MYSYIIYLLDEKEIKIENTYFSKIRLFEILKDRDDYIELEDYIIPKSEIKYIKYIEKEEEENGNN